MSRRVRRILPAQVAAVLVAVVVVAGSLAFIVHSSESTPPARAYLGIVPEPGTTNTVIGTISGISSPWAGTFDPANGDIYLADSTAGFGAGDNSSNVTIISTSTNSVVGQYFLGEYSNPQPPTYAPSDQEVYVANDNDSTTMDNVTALSGTQHIAAIIPTGNGSAPTTPLYDPVNHDLYVADPFTPYVDLLGENVTVINTANNEVVTTIQVGEAPITGAFDPADGYIYIPNWGDGSGTNLSIIDPGTNTVIGNISGLNTPVTPVYDPVNQDLYVMNTGVGAYNLTVIHGTSVVATILVDPSYSNVFNFGPTVDPVTGDIYVPLAADDEVAVYAPSNTLVTDISGGVNYFSDYQGVYDPADGTVYLTGSNDVGDGGEVFAINGSTNTVTVAIAVGWNPESPIFDNATNELYVPNLNANNVSVIGGGPVKTTSNPGTYTVTFEETGLPSGVSWNVSLDGLTVNSTATSIPFVDEKNGSHSYTIGPWGDESTCTLGLSTVSGTITVAGKPYTFSVPFSCAPGSKSPSGSSGSSSGFLGLPGDDGYLLLGGVVVILVGVVVAVLLLRPARPPPMVPAGPAGPPVPPPPPP